MFKNGLDFRNSWRKWDRINCDDIRHSKRHFGDVKCRKCDAVIEW